MLRYFGTSTFLTLAAIVVALLTVGIDAALTIAVLIAIEIAFSFDNAIINAKILERLSNFWQQLFLTVGMVFAIVGVRFIFPILIVMVTAGLSWSAVIDAALHHPHAYAAHLKEAHAAISAFGGGFLMALTFYFLFDDARKILWLKKLEGGLQKVGGTVWLPPLLVAAVVTVVSIFAGHEKGTVFRAGLIGVGSYAAMKLLIDGLERFTPRAAKIYTGWPAFLAFMYLQLLDASFSFDGVLGAFAITDKVLLIALGLGVGAIWVRSLTVFLVRKGTLNSYKYLEHGAHYAILVLAVALFASIFIEVPDAITGIIGLGVIGASFLSSREAKRVAKV
jgi:hypothetical protein